MYSRLNPARNEIRTIILHPGKWDDEISCSLQVVSLDDNPEYSTLSYVWGDPTQIANIKVDGHVIPARLNLEKSLRRIRNESQGRVLWVDAVCINQVDVEERSRQVRIMGRIYKSTRECIMWLGELEEEPIEPFHRLESWNPAEVTALEGLIQDLKLTTPETLRNAGKETASIDVPGAFEIIELLTQNKHFHEMPFYRILPTGGIELCELWSKAVYSLENILRRTWWRRIWTAQEAFLPDRAVIHVGPHSIPYAKFTEGVNSWDFHIWTACCLSILDLWMGYSSNGLRPAMKGVKELNSLQEIRTNSRSQSVAHSLFQLSIHRSSTLRHDRIYGLFGLITEFFQLDTEPDYSMSLARLYATTTIKFMANAKHLCLLPYARPQHIEHILDKQEKEFLRELPSWTPDWGTYAWDDYFDIYNYGGFTADKMLSYDGAHQCDTILKLEGFAVGTISVVGRLINDMKVPPGKFVPIIQEWLDLAKGKDLPPRAVWEIVHVATHKDVGLEKVDLQEAWWELLKGLADNDATFQEMRDAATVKQLLFCVASMDWLDKRAVFVTEPNSTLSDRTVNSDEISEYRSAFPQGSIGLALPNIREGDFIFIVKGGRTPLIFRPLSDALLRSKAIKEGIPEEDLSKCFTLVGICYIYEMMQGQALAENPRWEQIYIL